MFKHNQYNGEIWVSEKQKYFCVLEKYYSTIILKTKFKKNTNGFFIEKIYGSFLKLGYVTFYNLFERKNSTGVISYHEYEPKYIFVSSESFVEQPNKLTTKKISFYNDSIVEFIRKANHYDWLNKTIEINSEIDLKIHINKSRSLITNGHFDYQSSYEKLLLVNRGKFSIEDSEGFDLVSAIDQYNLFKEFMILFHGNFGQFNYSRIILDKDYVIDLYYKDEKVLNTSNMFLGFTYQQIENEYTSLLKNWFTNEDFRLVGRYIIDNLLYPKLDNKRKFTTSCSTFEAFVKRFVKNENSKFNFTNELKSMEVKISIYNRFR